MSEETVESVSQEELRGILEAKKSVLELVKVAEEAARVAKMADLQYQVTVQQVFINHGLSTSDRIDDSTGVITRGPVAEPVESEAVAEASEAPEAPEAPVEPVVEAGAGEEATA